MSSSLNEHDGPTQMPFSQIAGTPSFRSQAQNTVALIPLLSSSSNDKDNNSQHSSNNNNNTTTTTTTTPSYSIQSFYQLLEGLTRYSQRDSESSLTTPRASPENKQQQESSAFDNDDDDMSDVDMEQSQHALGEQLQNNTTNTYTPNVTLVIPNSQLTRPGEWRYERTPLKNFHWGHGCQRMQCFDGRPNKSRMAHDCLCNAAVSRNWIDLVPSQRTAAVVGILNMRDVKTSADLETALHELQHWSERYSTPPYQVTAHGRSFARDGVVQRLFVFDSFDDACIDVDLTQTKLGSNLVAFPPHGHVHMMDLHLNVVINDLAVAIFRQLEIKIRESDTLAKEKGLMLKTPTTPAQGQGAAMMDQPQASELSINDIASVVSPENKLASMSSPKNSPTKTSIAKTLTSRVKSGVAAAHNKRGGPGGGSPQLLTPLDSEPLDLHDLSPKDADAMKKRELGRREKFAADLSLLAGSPMDAYERYSRAAELCKSSPDPLWYASALEGCAAAHICMAEAGGYNVDLYLETNFQLPDELMQLAHNPGTSGGGDDNPNASTKQRNVFKQTLPTVVYALTEEALNITNRHIKLAPYHAEMILKLANYAAELEEGHLRCRWGEGPSCHGGNPGEPRRWDKTTVAQLTWPELKSKDGDDLIALNSVQRLQKWTEYMHRAVGTGGLDPLTRADVALVCARMALVGMQATSWKNFQGHRIKVPRKAAFFTAIAAESLSKCDDLASSSLWLAACQLYSNEGNSSKDDGSSYGWAALRAATLDALSQQEDHVYSEAAAELLLTLLSEISPKDEVVAPDDFVKVERDNEERLDDQSIMSKSTRYSRLSASSKYSKSGQSSSSRSILPSKGQSSFLRTVHEARWADDEPVPSAPFIPLEEAGEQILSLNCVLSDIDTANCAAAQNKCINHIADLRQGMPAVNDLVASSQPSIYENCGARPPLNIASATIVKSESHLLIERTKAIGYSGKATDGAMATFFNPFDNKKKQAEKLVAATLVAEGEEREVLVEFENTLSVPLEISSCQLEFDQKDSDRIKAPALSFVVPAKEKNFKAHFPFIVIAKPRGAPQAETEGQGEPNIYEVTGVRFAALSRSYMIPISPEQKDDADGDDEDADAPDKMIPDPASVYKRSKHNVGGTKKKDIEIKPRFETLPAQPNLVVSFTTSQTAIEDGTTVPVHLSDGEIFTLPSFRLENNLGPSGLGTMERLQIVGVGLPGLPEEVLFDTDAIAAAREAEEMTDSDQEEEDFAELMQEDGLPPLKMKASCENLSLESINDKSKSLRKEGSVVTFQVAATHDMGNQLDNGGHVKIRFRYRGVSPNPAAELWRKRQVSLRIVRVKGPRISSLTFRPDLGWGSGYSELCKALAAQKNQRAINDTSKANASNNNKTVSILHRVGMDSGVHVASEDVVILMAVANETSSTILLSNRKGRVGGFDGSPMPTVRVTSGVSVKIPVVIPRISRVDLEEEEDGVADIAAELITNTALQWSSVLDDAGVAAIEDSSSVDDSVNRKIRQGRVRIPSRCLREIMSVHPSFVAKICKPPVSVKVSIGRSSGAKCLMVTTGTPVDTFVEVETADWVPKEVIESCSLTLEFCCARKGANSKKMSEKKKEYVWFGRIRRTLPWSSSDEKTHCARIAFVETGSFVVSACAKISRDESSDGVEETWWAPIAENVIVEPSTKPPLSNNGATAL